MAQRQLRVVRPGETPAAPKTLEDAAGLDRRALLVRSRLEIAKVIDAGVPAHALARLIAEMNSLDAEVRRLDAVESEESGGVDVGDGEFDASAI